MTELDQRIKTKKETTARRAEMSIRCFELKLQYNKLSTNQKEKLNLFFKQAKYLANDIISSEDIFGYDYKTKSVNVKWFKDKVEFNENRDIILPSQMKQDIKTKLITDIVNLSKAKSKGMTVGKLKFRKEVKCIGLKQYGTTWKFGDKNRFYIAGIGWVRVSGKEQITPTISEFGCAKLIRKPTGYVVQVTGFYSKEPQKKVVIEPKDIVGIDFGIKDHITLTTGEKHNFKFDDSKVIREQKKLSKEKKGSNNRFKQILKVRKQHQKLTNKKDDTSNKFVSQLKNQYKLIFIQDENLKGWHSGLFGKQVQHSILGRIKSKLLKLNTTGVVDRFQPTTKLCPNCGALNKLQLNDRIYVCKCGFIEDRDTKSARTTAVIGLMNYVHTERMDFKPAEILTTELTDKYQLLFGKFKLESMKQDAPTL
ncbi:MAG: hypothetical protein RLY43_1599 [Bacteroidota bacterium]